LPKILEARGPAREAGQHPRMSPAAPATNWRENVAPDEATRYEDYARILAGLQSAATQKIGCAGRALHRKGHLGAAASFEALGNLPEPYAAGFFARPGSYCAYVRFSNGGPVHGSERFEVVVALTDLRVLEQNSQRRF
jgi:hypothetical protein